jgi:hypothetical protein
VTVTNLLIFMLVSQILVAAYLLYSFNDVERESRRRQNSVKTHVDRQIAELERRLATGAFRSPDEINRVIAADMDDDMDQRRAPRRPHVRVPPVTPTPGARA